MPYDYQKHDEDLDLDNLVLEIYRVIMKKNNISKGELFLRIEEKINEGIYNKDLEIRKKWEKMPRLSDKITPYDYIIHLIKTVYNEELSFVEKKSEAEKAWLISSY